jgi:hypothetical protein
LRVDVDVDQDNVEGALKEMWNGLQIRRVVGKLLYLEVAALGKDGGRGLAASSCRADDGQSHLAAGRASGFGEGVEHF